MIPCHGLIYVVFIFCMVAIDIHLNMREDIGEREDRMRIHHKLNHYQQWLLHNVPISSHNISPHLHIQMNILFRHPQENTT